MEQPVVSASQQYVDTKLSAFEGHMKSMLGEVERSFSHQISELGSKVDRVHAAVEDRILKLEQQLRILSTVEAQPAISGQPIAAESGRDLARDIEETRMAMFKHVDEVRAQVMHDTADIVRSQQALLDATESLTVRSVSWRVAGLFEAAAVPGKPEDRTIQVMSPAFNIAGLCGLKMQASLQPAASANVTAPEDPALIGYDINEWDLTVFIWSATRARVHGRVVVSWDSTNRKEVRSKRIELAPTRWQGFPCERVATIRTEYLGMVTLTFEALEVTVTQGTPGWEDECLPWQGDSDFQPLWEPGIGFRHAMKSVKHVQPGLGDQISAELTLVRHRSARRVEWVIDDLQRRRWVPQGTAFTSPLFSAAGIDRMQLLFYPTGYVTAAEGFCSAFLVAPVGTRVKVDLLVGDKQRTLQHLYETSDQPFGRANFCILDEAIARGVDHVVVAVDFHEAVQFTVGACQNAFSNEHVGVLKMRRVADTQGMLEALVLPGDSGQGPRRPGAKSSAVLKKLPPRTEAMSKSSPQLPRLVRSGQ
mmetsp:Transcript_46434/g.105366  ORF Transcript_46434/g.105366 Transcript_46434/m.105366 type:complete len:534 (+) Transcript_46434:50-1651(+)